MEATRSSSPSAHTGAVQRTKAHEAQGTRAPGKMAEAGAGQAPQDGFSLLLAALGDGAGSGLGASDEGVDALAQEGDPATAPSALSALGVDPSLLPPLPPGGAPTGAALSPADSATLAALAGAAGLSGMPGTAAGADATEARQGLSSVSLADGRFGSGAMSGSNALWARGAGKAGVESLVGQTAMLDGAAEAAAVSGAPGAGGGVAAPMRGVGGRFQAAWAAAGFGAGAADAGAAPGAAALRAGAADSARASMPDAAAALAAATNTALPAGATDHRDAAIPAGGAGSHRPASETLAALPSGLFTTQPDTAAGADGRSSSGRGADGFSSTAAGAAGAAQSEATREPSGVDAFAAELSGASADAAQRAAEDVLAEQVAYWVHQNTQNAELTLDRDGQPVQVTVSLSGSEAHIAFRSDQAGTRDLLDGSVAQLRELLQAEGLQLTGVTVGASGSSGARDGGGSGAGGDRPRPGMRQAMVQASAPAGAAGRARQAGGERAVDIFV
ncbi:flagellar hook-length control protein FliK [Acidovorax sp. FG27]|uniref:flagellar hook-length control protein FliK n=1 Tax=Acidovorax sp. FG27 TaxID=3133652 RepID=UPI0030E84D50